MGVSLTGLSLSSPNCMTNLSLALFRTATVAGINTLLRLMALLVRVVSAKLIA